MPTRMIPTKIAEDGCAAMTSDPSDNVSRQSGTLVDRSNRCRCGARNAITDTAVTDSSV